MIALLFWIWLGGVIATVAVDFLMRDTGDDAPWWISVIRIAGWPVLVGWIIAIVVREWWLDYRDRAATPRQEPE